MNNKSTQSKHQSTQKSRNSSSQMIFKIGVLKTFVNFTGKHLCWSLFFKKRLQHRCFPVIFTKVLRAPFLQTPLVAASRTLANACNVSQFWVWKRSCWCNPYIELLNRWAPWTEDINWRYKRGLEDVQDIFWTSYVHSIYVLYPEGDIVA